MNLWTFSEESAKKLKVHFFCDMQIKNQEEGSRWSIGEISEDFVCSFFFLSIVIIGSTTKNATDFYKKKNQDLEKI